MKKIVIVIEETANDNGLITLLNALFPECEISTVSLNREGLETRPNDPLSGFVTTAARGGSHGNYHLDGSLPGQ